MRFRSLDELVRAGFVEPKPPDPARVERWIVRSRADIDLAGRVLAPIDSERAIGVAYEAGYRPCAGILVLAGYRVTSQPAPRRREPCPGNRSGDERRDPGSSGKVRRLVASAP